MFLSQEPSYLLQCATGGSSINPHKIHRPRYSTVSAIETAPKFRRNNSSPSTCCLVHVSSFFGIFLDVEFWSEAPPETSVNFRRIVPLCLSSDLSICYYSVSWCPLTASLESSWVFLSHAITYTPAYRWAYCSARLQWAGKYGLPIHWFLPQGNISHTHFRQNGASVAYE